MSRLLCFNVFASTSPQLGVRSIAISVCVCLSARISQNHSQTSHAFSVLDVNCGCDSILLCYVLPVLWMMSYLPIMGHMARGRLLKMTRGAHGFDIATNRLTTYAQSDSQGGNTRGRSVMCTIACALGPLCRSSCVPLVMSDGSELSLVESIRYLGVFIVRSCYFCSFDNAKTLSTWVLLQSSVKWAGWHLRKL